MREGGARGLGQRRLALAFVFFGGLAAWAIDFGIGYAASPHWCDRSLYWPLHGLTAATGLLAAASVAVALLMHRSSGGQPTEVAAGRTRFIATSGVVLGLLSLLAIILSEFAIVVLRCR